MLQAKAGQVLLQITHEWQRSIIFTLTITDTYRPPYTPSSSQWSGLHVVLCEHQVPDLQDVWHVHVDQVLGVPAPNAVKMNLGAWPTWPCVSHLPEVVLHSKGHHSLLWQSADVGHIFFTFQVELKMQLYVSLSMIHN